MNEHLLKINRIAQEIESLEDGVTWFSLLEDESKSAVMQDFVKILLQSHPRKEEIDSAIASSLLKPTYTPCVLVNKLPFSEACTKILTLPKSEITKSFRLWLEIFKASDGRRRDTVCKNGCSHEWHNISGL